MEKEERNFAKLHKVLQSKGRIGVRASRKEAMDTLKIAQKEGLPEDDVKRAEKEVQKLTDDMGDQITQAVSAKESDLRKV